MRARTLSALVVSGLMALAACSSDDDGTVTAPEESSDAAHNDADVAFAQGMIPHHQQAVEMAQLAEGRAEDPAVLDLAGRIEAAQAPEIEQLTAWLEEWGEDPAGMEGMEGMEGMDSATMSTEDMEALEAASGPEFDRMFLEMMIEHHEGAIAMAETEIESGEFPDAVAMAEEIVATQQAEIDEMTDLLAGAG